MPTRLMPEIGRWYAHRDKGLVFQVVAVDEAGDNVEIQDCDGDVDEVDLESWFTLPLEPAAAPEDSHGVLDDADTEDPDLTLAADGAEHGWRDPLDQVAVELEDLDDDDADDGTPLHH